MEEDVKRAAEAAGFAMQSVQAVSEIDGTAFQMEHETSGAKLLFLKCDDVDKSFSITFKTPAADDTGVFHILEHSVLCGSEKFPVKEPFVNLLKGSMQTFLNAMTFPDKTMYPVASTNMTDLMNLTDVYMDAVFHPRIYSTEDIFRQEGWHLEALRRDVEGASPEGELEEVREAEAGIPLPLDPKDVDLSFNGVVYNEMKGALSEAESVLYDALSAALFPDTTYRFESGGTPEAIPDLTYEAFLDSHTRHYRADNCYIILYGDMDIQRMLSFLDEEYLSKMPKDSSVLATNPLDLQPPVINMDAKVRMRTAKGNACAALGYVVGTSHDVERVVATDILMDAIAGSNEAPLKKRMLEESLSDDFNAYLADSVLQPFVVMQLKGAKEGAADRFEGIVQDEVRRLADGALDPALIHAAITHAEFIMREHNLGYSDGVIYSMAAMNGWLYDPDDALAYVRFEELFADLKAKADTGWFEGLLRELFLESNHHGRAQVIPVEGEDAQDPRLADLARTLDASGLAQIEEEMERLVQAQMAPDTSEALATLPHLSVSDIKDAPFEPGFTYSEEGGARIIRHDVETHGIVYATRYYGLECMSYEDLPYASVLAMLLGRLDTDEHTASELDTLIQGSLGNLSFAPDTYEPLAATGIPTEAVFVASASALAENAPAAAKLADEVISGTRFSDKAKVRDILVQAKVGLERTFAMAGHSAAANRALSYVSHTAKAKEQYAGIDFYLFLRELTEHFDERFDRLVEKLEELRSLIFSDDNCILSFAGTDADLEAYRRASAGLGMSAHAREKKLHIPEPHDAHEAFAVSSDVTFTSLAADRKPYGMPFSGEWLLASRMLTYGFLWNEVRVVGGAYGVGFTSRRGGQTYFHSYRDPKIDPTLAAFQASADWLSELDIPDEEFEGYQVSTVAAMDSPLKPRDLVKRQDSMHFIGCTEEDRAKTRQELLAATKDSVRALAQPLRKLVSANHICCVGDAKLIAECKERFCVIDLT